jgi:hypothetical protein
VNPESRDEAANDTLRARLVGSSVETLALAYHFTGEEKYAEHAAKILRTWFLDPATKMTPHFRFAQAIPGVNDGRGTGILEARGLADAADAATLLHGSKHWSAADQQALLAWAATYFEWLTTSKNGLDERAAKNNHGTWYDVQAVKWALVLGRKDQAKEICAEATYAPHRRADPAGRQAAAGTGPHGLFQLFLFQSPRAVRARRPRRTRGRRSLEASLRGRPFPRGRAGFPRALLGQEPQTLDDARRSTRATTTTCSRSCVRRRSPPATPVTSRC